MRLIDADELIKVFDRDDANLYESAEKCTIHGDVKDIIKIAPTVMQWVSVEEGLPDPWQKVNVFLDNGKILTVHTDGNGRWCDIQGHHNESVTHWMPLPEPPVNKYRL